jgi:serine/threonine protein kinase
VTPERWRVVTEIFHAALERPIAERSAYLVEVCTQDPSLRGDVEALLAGDDRADVAGDPLVTGHAALSPGAMLGPYRVDALLDAGGMGEVYKARDTRLHRDVAIKVLPAHSSADVDARARFEREGRAIASLSHPNICAVFDVGHEAGHDYLVMELLEGDTLNQWLTRGAFPITALVDAAVELADALELAHARGLIHRDLKPANIFVTTRGQLKILDFGLAKMVAAVDGPTMQNGVVTGTAVVVGTIAYMSPEQLRGESLDGRTDLFSLGLVLYELATGQRAFTGATSAVVSAAILGQEPAAPRALRAELPVRLEEAILKLLEKDRVVRCQSAAELRADLRRVKRQMQTMQPIAASITNAHAALQWLSADPPNLGEVREALDRIVKDGGRASDVVGRLRTLSKKAPPLKDNLSINEAVLDVIALTRGEVVKNGVSLRTELAEGLPRIQADRIQLEQVILNVIVNAVEAMSDTRERSREMFVGTERDAAGGVVVTVQDSGPGLNSESFDRLFDAFYTTKSRGMGMGLSICRSIIEAHGGRIWASRNVDSGVTFQFNLPVPSAPES